MTQTIPCSELQRGFEQGPIRPPSEAGSLLLRVSRNCSWNRCTFCPLYRDEAFSLRSAGEVMADIDAVAVHIHQLLEQSRKTELSAEILRRLHQRLPEEERASFRAAAHWLMGDMQSVFLQDADSLAAGAEVLLPILEHLRRTFPQVSRVTSYSRSATLVRYSLTDLQSLQRAGLNRLHLGLESGSDQVLRRVRKGASKDLHVRAGQLVRAAGMELSVYVMPGLGGKVLSVEHARETAEVLNRINPHFIRLRTLAVPDETPLAEEMAAGRFEPCSAVEIAEELLLLIESLSGIDSMVVSDHALNLFEDLRGRLPDDKNSMLALLKTFLNLEDDQRCLYLVGRRVGYFRAITNMQDPLRRAEVQKLCDDLGVTTDNVEAICRDLMKRFI